MLVLLLYAAAFILFVLAALNVPSSKLNLGWAGAACAMLAFLFQHWPK